MDQPVVTDHLVSDTAPPPRQDWLWAVESLTTDGHGAEQTWEQRAHEAEQRAHEAEQVAERAHRRIEALARALETRPQIDQAKGVLMAVFGLQPDAAFDALTWVSQHANVKLATIAGSFLDDVCAVDVGAPHREQVTHLLATLSNGGLRPAG